MKQYKAVEIISQAIINDGKAMAIFLKGSLARQTEDQYSDVDFYVVVADENYEQFLKKRLDYLNKYGHILYFTETYFVAPQIVCVFEDGLHFDFYVTKMDNINYYDNIAIIYDPHHLLDDYQKKPLSLNSQETANIVHSFCFAAVEFNAAYQRQDLLFAFRLANHMFADLACYLRTVIEPDFARIGLKGFYQNLSEPYRSKYLEIAKYLSLENCLLSVKMMLGYFDQLIINVPIRVAEFLNFEFFQFAKNLLMGME
ncbi:MAG TPA: aminoglycoside 6-adenylyltransferase [Bacilli bacterium]|nr:MAG: hypothetical protein BWY97_01233 [Tenericutes bacterium ADurb.BinA124]HNZ50723.1 aminoglycoside 6-adenylyltransferase [Bacilli bacterium]HPX84839.1 aminoglycoside 6-adenylyltransferase [Bacilli bacterium]